MRDTIDLAPITQAVMGEILQQFAAKGWVDAQGSLSLVSGFDLYTTHFDRFESVKQAATTADGKLSKNPNIKGHVFEALGASGKNVHSGIRGDGRVAMTTDEASARRRNGEDLGAAAVAYAVRNHPQVDVFQVTRLGGVICTEQFKAVQDTSALLADRYLGSEVKFIVVPKDDYKRHREVLEARIARGGKDTEKARIALRKLRASEVSTANLESPRLAITRGMVDHASKRVWDQMKRELTPLLVMGAAFEINQALRPEEMLSVTERLKRFLGIVINKIRAILKESAVILTTEVFHMVLALARNLLGLAIQLLRDISKYVSQISRLVWDYITGQIKSFSDLLVAVAKLAMAVAITALYASVEAKLQQFLPFLPGWLNGMISVVLVAMLAVLARKGVEAVVYGLVGQFRKQAAAASLREQVEAACAEVLPRLMARRSELERLMREQAIERQALFAASFRDLDGAAGCDKTIVAALESINAAFGKALGWKCQAEFDAMMLDDGRAFAF